MKVKPIERLNVVVELTVQESQQLMGFVQNPICDQESHYDAEFRKDLFLGIKSVLSMYGHVSESP